MSGKIVDVVRPPGPGWHAVEGRGALFRKREKGRWSAIYAYPPDAPLWHAQGWERVRFVPAEPAGPARRGSKSGLRFAFAPPSRGEMGHKDPPTLWVVLPDELAWSSPAARPGAQARFATETLREGVAAADLAGRLFLTRIARLGLPMERALWVLKGPPVSPEDGRLLRKLAPVIALGERLAADLKAAAPDPAPNPLPEATPRVKRALPPPRTAGRPRGAPARPRRGRQVRGRG